MMLSYSLEELWTVEIAKFLQTQVIEKQKYPQTFLDFCKKRQKKGVRKISAQNLLQIALCVTNIHVGLWFIVLFRFNKKNTSKWIQLNFLLQGIQIAGKVTLKCEIIYKRGT